MVDSGLIWNEVEYKKLLEFLLKEKGFLHSMYRDNYLSRRVESRLYATCCGSLSKYLRLLKNDDSELIKLYDALTINVSSFFRNKEVFDFLREQVFPEIIKQKIRLGENSINIWSMGCSTGEEPYSLAILIQRHLRIRMKRFKLRINAVDINSKALGFAKKGVYSRNRLGNLDPKIIRAFFVPVKDGYKACDLIRGMINFQQQDILKFQSINTIFDLILCRNMLIYFSKKNHFKAYNYFSRHLSPGGYLVLGKAEIMFSPWKNHLENVSIDHHIYRKTGAINI